MEDTKIQDNEHCINCGDILEFQSDEPTLCGKQECQLLAEELLLDNSAIELYQDNPRLFQLLIESAHMAIKSERKYDLFEPFPSHFLKDPSLNMERGQLTGMASEDIRAKFNDNKDFDKISSILKDCSFKKIESILSSEDVHTDQDLQSAVGEDTYSLIRFIIKSNKMNLKEFSFIMEIPPSHPGQEPMDMTGFRQFEIKYPMEIEEEFAKNVSKYGSMFLFHGSGTQNWYSIMRNGLKIMSNTRMMTAGAAHGAGIYMARSLSTSLNYCRNSNGQITFGVFEVLNIPAKLRNSGGIIVVQDDKILLQRYLFVIPTGKMGYYYNSNLVRVFDEKFNRKIHQQIEMANNTSKNIRNKRLMNEYKKCMDLDFEKLGFYIDLPDESNILLWNIYVTRFDEDSNIHKQMVEHDINHVMMEIRFPERYPIKPPFVRIVSPRFTYRTGHITSGGSICMEGLTNQGWSPANSIENLIVNIQSIITEGDGSIDVKRKFDIYSHQEAQTSFVNVARSHGWN